VSNTRQRYLKQYEADALLAELKARSPQTHDLSLLSLHTGMRFSEITGLTWGCIDLEAKRIHVLNAKGDKDRTLPMTEAAFSLLAGLRKGRADELVFPSRTGGRIYHVSKSFDDAVKALGLNEHVTDPKHRFTFHCLRHSHASWLIETGADLYLVQKLLGHSTPVVTQRYSHVADEQLAEAVKRMEAGLERKQRKGKVVSLR